MRPALYLNLSSSTQYFLAGTVCSDGTVNEKVAPGTTTAKVKISSIKLSGISKKIAAGKKIKLTANITTSNASIKKLKWTSSNKKVATVTQNGVVKMTKKGKRKSVTIMAAATDGSGKKKTVKIKIK